MASVYHSSSRYFDTNNGRSTQSSADQKHPSPRSRYHQNRTAVNCGSYRHPRNSAGRNGANRAGTDQRKNALSQAWRGPPQSGPNTLPRQAPLNSTGPRSSPSNRGRPDGEQSIAPLDKPRRARPVDLCRDAASRGARTFDLWWVAIFSMLAALVFVSCCLVWGS